MGRPPLCRRVSYIPSVTYFKPAGIPLRELEEVCLSVEEVEAIRLKDIEDLEQEQCAERMNISRPTFVRVLDAARKKMATALINGKAIRIEGGNFEMGEDIMAVRFGGPRRGQGRGLSSGRGGGNRRGSGGIPVRLDQAESEKEKA